MAPVRTLSFPPLLNPARHRQQDQRPGSAQPHKRTHVMQLLLLLPSLYGPGEQARRTGPQPSPTHPGACPACSRFLTPTRSFLLFGDSEGETLQRQRAPKPQAFLAPIPHPPAHPPPSSSEVCTSNLQDTTLHWSQENKLGEGNRLRKTRDTIRPQKSRQKVPRGKGMWPSR